MRRTRLRAAAITLGLGLPLGLFATAPAVAATGPMAFEPIEGSAYGQMSTDWTEPLVAPEGFTQELVADETVLDIYGGTTDDPPT